MEILAFINFKFEIRETSTKVIIADRIQDEKRYTLNWKDYTTYLDKKGVRINLSMRSFLAKYAIPRTNTDIFNDLIGFQKELIELIDFICINGRIPYESWIMIFREAEKAREIILPGRQVNSDVSEKDLLDMEFNKELSAESYRSFLFGQLRNLIVRRLVFRIKKCPECQAYFVDQTRNGAKVYCTNRPCAHRARLRELQRRKTVQARLAGQREMEFSAADDPAINQTTVSEPNGKESSE
jgi:hypothetical protein